MDRSSALSGFPGGSVIRFVQNLGSPQECVRQYFLLPHEDIISTCGYDQYSAPVWKDGKDIKLAVHLINCVLQQ